jgi:hypothetical protein
MYKIHREWRQTPLHVVLGWFALAAAAAFALGLAVPH